MATDNSETASDKTEEVTAVTPAPKAPVDVPLDQETAYNLPAATLTEHEYSRAAVIELRRVRASIDALAGAILQAAGQGAQLPAGEVSLKEPAVKSKPRHRDEANQQTQAEPLSMVEPVPQDDPVSLVEVDPDEATPESKSKSKKE